MSKPVEITIDPYVRNHYGRGVAVWGCFSFNPWMARRLAQRLLDAADRLDPHNRSLPPWQEKKKE